MRDTPDLPIVPDFSKPLDLTDHAALVEHGKLLCRRNCQDQVWALISAGWTFELPPGHLDPEPWQWYWRRPPKRAGRPGRLFPSTGQAFNAMKREQH